ncbi:MAG: GNAT family N-acetyltransferase [Clostridia bacterium]
MIRSFRVEDAPYIVSSHHEIYANEYGYDESFRRFVAQSVEQFMESWDHNKENMWIVEIDQQPKGSIGITKVNEQTAQLRLFLVEPSLRGTGMGRQLVQTVIDFCREKQYETIQLWTNRDLTAARALYEKFGFAIQETRTQVLSGQELVEERWELSLV